MQNHQALLGTRDKLLYRPICPLKQNIELAAFSQLFLVSLVCKSDSRRQSASVWIEGHLRCVCACLFCHLANYKEMHFLSENAPLNK